MMIRIPDLSFTIAESLPPSGSRTIANVNYRLGVEIQVTVESRNSVPLEFGVEIEDGKLQAKMEITHHLSENTEASLNLPGLLESLAEHALSSPNALATALTENTELKHKFGEDCEVSLSFDRDAPFCFINVEFRFANYQYPATGFSQFPGTDWDVRYKFEGKFTVKFGPNAAGWRVIGRGASSAVRMLSGQFARLGAAEIAAASGFVVVAAVAVGGGLAVAWAAAEMINRARREGYEVGLATHYARGYLHVVFIRRGTNQEEADTRRANASVRASRGRGGAAERAWQLGFNHAHLDTDRITSSALIQLRKNLFHDIGVTGFDATSPSPANIATATTHLAYLIVQNDESPHQRQIRERNRQQTANRVRRGTGGGRVVPRR